MVNEEGSENAKNSLLKILYDITRGKTTESVALRQLSTHLNLDNSEIISIIIELHKQDLIRSTGTLDFISISPAGINYVEKNLLASEKDDSDKIKTIKSKRKKLIFISHINEDKQVAVQLKDLLKALFPEKIEIFVSSDTESIQYGTEWFPPIKQKLSECDVALILCSPISIMKPWINFETGAAVILDRPTIPLCYGGQKCGELPEPLSHYRGADAENIEDLTGMLTAISRIINIPISEVDVSQSEFYQTIASLGVQNPANIPYIAATLQSATISKGDNLVITGSTSRSNSEVTVELFKFGDEKEPRLSMSAPTGSDGSFSIFGRSDSLSSGQYGAIVQLPTGEWTKLAFLVNERKEIDKK
jgi:hypothetical protein